MKCKTSSSCRISKIYRLISPEYFSPHSTTFKATSAKTPLAPSYPPGRKIPGQLLGLHLIMIFGSSAVPYTKMQVQLSVLAGLPLPRGQPHNRLKTRIVAHWGTPESGQYTLIHSPPSTHSLTADKSACSAEPMPVGQIGQTGSGAPTPLVEHPHPVLGVGSS